MAMTTVAAALAVKTKMTTAIPSRRRRDVRLGGGGS
jgi:hypothetical protein